MNSNNGWPPEDNPVAATEEAHAPQTAPLLSAETRAAHALAKASNHICPRFTAEEMIDVLENAAAREGDGEAMMFYQSQVLDALFHRLAGEASQNGYTHRECVDLALRLQRQCRSNIDSVAFLKYLKQKT